MLEIIEVNFKHIYCYEKIVIVDHLSLAYCHFKIEKRRVLKGFSYIFIKYFYVQLNKTLFLIIFIYFFYGVNYIVIYSL